jgi:hypothetical protein
MSERGTQLFQMADGQLSELIDLLSTRDEATLSLPCPGRQKLADGTVGALATHTADNYLRIADFIAADPTAPPSNSTHRSFRSIASRFAGHGRGEHGPSMHAPGAAGTTDRAGVLDRLSNGREAMRALDKLTDEQLDTVPPASDMKFCDGQRTLEQIATSLLNHQNHQLDALKDALASCLEIR